MYDNSFPAEVHLTFPGRTIQGDQRAELVITDRLSRKRIRIVIDSDDFMSFVAGRIVYSDVETPSNLSVLGKKRVNNTHLLGGRNVAEVDPDSVEITKNRFRQDDWIEFRVDRTRDGENLVMHKYVEPTQEDFDALKIDWKD